MSEKTGKKKSKLILIILGGLAVLCILCLIGTMISNATPAGKAASTERAIKKLSETPEPTEVSENTEPDDAMSEATEVPDQDEKTHTSEEVQATNTPAEPTETLEPLDALEQGLRSLLGENNRDMEQISDFYWDDTLSEIVITVTGDDNFTDDMIKRGMMMDIGSILQFIDESGTSVPYEQVCVVVTFPLVDTFGNETESNVIIATYTRENIEKVNWENFLTDNIFAIAIQEYLFLHPALPQD